MPEKFEINWRMKGDSQGTRVWGDTEFIVLPQHGTQLNYKMFGNDFCNLIHEHEYWRFVVKMGQFIIYELSTVLVAIRNWSNSDWQYDLSWDSVELTTVP